MSRRNLIQLFRLLEETVRDQSSFARQRNLDNPTGEVSGEVLYGLSQALVVARVQLERQLAARIWWKPWTWLN